MQSKAVGLGAHAVKYHHLAAGQLVHHKATHILVINRGGGSVDHQNLLIDHPVFGNGVIEGVQLPHAVVLNDHNVGTGALLCGGESVGREPLGIVKGRISDVPTHFDGIKLLLAFLAEDNEILAHSVVEVGVLHSIGYEAGLSRLEKAGEEIYRNFHYSPNSSFIFSF